MLIGEEFDKIHFEAFGLDLMEPNAFIGDVIIFSFAFYFAYKLRSFHQTPFVKNWIRFFILFGLGFLIGGFGHLLYNYTGVPGKYFGWFAGFIYIFFIEQAILPFIEKEKTKSLLILISKIKLILVILAEIVVVSTIDLDLNFAPAMKIPLINSSVGLVFCLGVLSYQFMKKLNSGFKYFIFSVLIMLPSMPFQTMNINFAPWFDKNDVGHLFVFIGIFFYYFGVNKIAKYQENLTNG